MAVTAKLSRRFYEKLVEDVANELVEWFNSVHATYRSDLRERNELNFARFDAEVDQRIGPLAAMLEQRLAELGAGLRMGMEARFALVDARFETLEAKLLQRLETRIDGAKRQMLRRMFVLWTGIVLAFLAARLLL